MEGSSGSGTRPVSPAEVRVDSAPEDPVLSNPLPALKRRRKSINSTMVFRSSSYSPAEDIHLCSVYVGIKQDPILGANQTESTLWSRVETNYNSTQSNFISETRNAKSLRDRWAVIKGAVSKLNACIAQVELLNPSGASNEDIIYQAKILLMQDPKYKKGFMFDHVWLNMKDFVNSENNSRRRRNNNLTSSQLDASMLHSRVFSSPGISQFNINLNDENAGGSSLLTRPNGVVKKAKLKREKGEDLSRALKSVEEANKRIEILIAESNLQQKRAVEEFAKRRDVRIMSVNLETISDPARREWFLDEQFKIMQKSTHQSQP